MTFRSEAVRAMHEIEKVTRFRGGGIDFSTREDAETWVASTFAAEQANAMLSAGASLGEIQARFPERDGDRYLGWGLPHLPECVAVLTITHKLAIQHWQCRDQPGYSVTRIDVHQSGRWQLYVWGNAGSWSGPYGSLVSLLDLERYVTD